MENNWSGYLPAAGYQEFKGLVDKELNQAAEGFVRIGYLLKVARDTNILYESGYRNVAEFAFHEYGLSKDVVSRYIAINDRYSQGGYSEVLADRYQGFGMAKLAEMLTLPDNLVNMIPADLTKADIREIKKEYAEEQETSDIELAIEAAGQAPDTLSAGERILYEYFKTNPEEYRYLPTDTFGIKEYLKPGDSKILAFRIPGTGRSMMTLTDTEEIKIATMRGETLPSWNWTELLEYIKRIAPEGDRKKMWSDIYGEPFPEQEKTVTEKPEKPKKVEVIKPKKKREVAPAQPKPVEVEVIPGVKAIIEDEEKASEAAEQEMKKAEIMAVPNHTEEPESVENTEREAITEATYEERMKELKTDCRMKWNDIDGCISMNMFLKAKQRVSELSNLIDEMLKLEDTPIIEYADREE